MVICSTNKNESTWLAELREDRDYSQLIYDLASKKLDKNRISVKVPRCSNKFVVADFAIENGDLVLLDDDRSMKIVPKSCKKACIRGDPYSCYGRASEHKEDAIEAEKNLYFGKEWRRMS
ncbi:hypothetical protein Y032_0153g2909 [Ancylostoma ceylanicum]|uniref:Uncharacterized protein n=1 Tax=Ancylostoma ceylanicum TaxID=53326 RepID=A0A016T092_9BILA|nr:hypothetical protein Y032_0153g2909 [Ancylostoma ceylanicum]